MELCGRFEKKKIGVGNCRESMYDL